MNMGSRKVNTEGIDEELLIASIGRRRQDGTKATFQFRVDFFEILGRDIS